MDAHNIMLSYGYPCFELQISSTPADFTGYPQFDSIYGSVKCFADNKEKPY